MNRLQKKCFLASATLHGLLVLVILFGAAFLGPPKEKPMLNRLNVVPPDVVEAALSGGGGNPKLERTDDQVKGNSFNAADSAPEPTPTLFKPPDPVPVQARPVPQPQVRQVQRQEPTKPSVIKPPDSPKQPNVTEKPAEPKLDLVPTVKGPSAKEKARLEAEARQAREASEKQAAFRKELTSKLGNMSSGLKAGFENGTKVDVGGDGAKAYAGYALLVQAAYDSAWQVQPDLAAQEFMVPVEVVIARDGHIVSQRILTRSGNAGMDRSVQRALDKVKATFNRPFPPETKDDEKTFVINFNLKSRRLNG